MRTPPNNEYPLDLQHMYERVARCHNIKRQVCMDMKIHSETVMRRHNGGKGSRRWR